MCLLPTAPAARTTSVIVWRRRSRTQPVINVAKLLIDGEVKHPANPCSSEEKLLTILASGTIAPGKTVGVVTPSLQKSISMDTPTHSARGLSRGFMRAATAPPVAREARHLGGAAARA